ncbi:RRN3 [Acrasis kona]|uniref:RRN3 n=1 Tax=Acrasis kona TaxID=1008807 RepID=A0AAW2ZLA2_9EUKA
MPQSVVSILKKLETDYPHHSQPLIYHRCYVTNLLKITEYAPMLHNQTFQIIVQQLIKLDSEIKIPREENDDEDEDEDDEDDEEEEEEEEAFVLPLDFEEIPKDAPEELRQVIFAEKLDTVMYILFDFIFKISTNPTKLQITFNSMMRQFHGFVVNTYQLHSIQFLMFYLCSFNEQYLNNFVQFLLTKIFDATLHQEVRKCCAAYLSGFISRAKYCPVKTVTAMLGQMLEWLNQYVLTHEKFVTYLDVESHSIFYSMCQGVFYVLCYKMHDMMRDEAGSAFLHNAASLTKVVQSNFNPLKIIALDVANEVTDAFDHYAFSFASVFRQIIERNKNVMVPMKGSYGGYNYLENNFFPFDPVLLRQSNQFILPLYQSWEGGVGSRRRSSNAGLYSQNHEEPLNQYNDSQTDDYFNDVEMAKSRSRNNSVNERANMFMKNLGHHGASSRSKLGTSHNSWSSSHMGEPTNDDDSDDDMSSDNEDSDHEDDEYKCCSDDEVDDQDHEHLKNVKGTMTMKSAGTRRNDDIGTFFENEVKEDEQEEQPYGWDCCFGN